MARSQEYPAWSRRQPGMQDPFLSHLQKRKSKVSANSLYYERVNIKVKLGTATNQGRLLGWIVNVAVSTIYASTSLMVGDNFSFSCPWRASWINLTLTITLIAALNTQADREGVILRGHHSCHSPLAWPRREPWLAILFGAGPARDCRLRDQQKVRELSHNGFIPLAPSRSRQRRQCVHQQSGGNNQHFSQTGNPIVPVSRLPFLIIPATRILFTRQSEWISSLKFFSISTSHTRTPLLGRNPSFNDLHRVRKPKLTQSTTTKYKPIS